MFSAAGRQFGKLTVMMPSDRAPHWWIARCECGGMWEGWKYSLLSGRTRSCGCDWHVPKHGRSGSPEHRLWRTMRQRCSNPRTNHYALYGGRGIRVCDRWDDFAMFLADIGPRPSPRHSLERIDNSRGYEPGNVRWALPTEQNRNMRSNVWLTHNGATLCLMDWSKKLGVNYGTLRGRLRKGWSVERVLTVGG